MGVFQRRKENDGGELAPVDTGAAGAENDNSDGAAGPNKRGKSKRAAKKVDEKAQEQAEA